MSGFTNGMLMGLGISLLFAPRTGQEMRSLLAERFKYLRGTHAENEELKQSVQHMAERVQSVQSEVGNLAQQTGVDVPQS
jgi:gas vesicle protein